MDKSQDNHAVSREIQQLVHRSFDGPISAVEIERIQQALAASQRARNWYSEVAQMHADLAAMKHSLDLCRQVHIECGEPTHEPTFREALTPNRFSGVVSRLRRFPFSIAASLLVVGIGLGCSMGLFAASIVHETQRFIALPWNWNVGHDVVARVMSTHDVAWESSESPETLPTQGLREGQQIRIEQGMINLRYRTGVNLILQGPAVFEIRSAHGGKLYAGRLSIVCDNQSAPFNVETSAGRLQVGPGHYGVSVSRVDEDAVGVQQQARVHVFDGLSRGTETAQFVNSVDGLTSLVVGDAMQFEHGQPPKQLSLASRSQYPVKLPRPRYESFRGTEIHLGNLFDDSKNTSLSQAMASDTFQATGETIDLGVATIHDGGLDVDVALAEDGVVFNFANVGGGGPKVRGLPGNDSYRSTDPVCIRTTGKDLIGLGPLRKVEEGIGMCTNELLTFDLDEIRNAGRLGDVVMRFVVDRAGINDCDSEAAHSYVDQANVHMVALVSTTDRVMSAYVNGEAFDVVKRGDVFMVDRDLKPMPPSLRYDGRYVSFDVLIPPDARFLTLATTMGQMEHCDHAVFSGARLELLPAQQDSASGNR